MSCLLVQCQRIPHYEIINELLFHHTEQLLTVYAGARTRGVGT